MEQLSDYKVRLFSAVLILIVMGGLIQAGTITVGPGASYDFETIQAGIDAARDGDTVNVAPGTYYENVFLKSGISLVGAGADMTVIDAGRFGDVVDASADNVMISGFTLRNSGEFDLGHMNCGVYVSESSPVIRNNVIANNETGIGVWHGPNPDIRNNVIKNNSGGLYIYGLEDGPSDPNIINNTIVNNDEDGITLRVMVSPIIRNNIITGNDKGINRNYVTGSPSISYNNLWNNNVNYIHDSTIDGSLGGPGSISADPGFAKLGHWVNINSPDIEVEPNDPNIVWIDGDYHLKSKTGRWNPASESWVVDNITSPCIDAGDPDDSIGDEPDPSGGRINMGAYGGTIEASMSYYPTEDPETNLTAHWKLDETDGDIAYDSAGDNDAVVHEGVWTTGKINGALDFNGLRTYMDCGYSEQLGLEQMTISMWLKPEHMGGMRYIAARSEPGSHKIDYAITRQYTGEVDFIVGQSDSEPVSVTSNGTTPLNEWSHVAVTLDGFNASIYINDQPDNSIAYSKRVQRAGYRLIISSLGANTLFYNGLIDDVRIYNRAITP